MGEADQSAVAFLTHAACNSGAKTPLHLPLVTLSSGVIGVEPTGFALSLSILLSSSLSSVSSLSLCVICVAVQLVSS